MQFMHFMYFRKKEIIAERLIKKSLITLIIIEYRFSITKELIITNNVKWTKRRFLHNVIVVSTDAVIISQKLNHSLKLQLFEIPSDFKNFRIRIVFGASITRSEHSFHYIRALLIFSKLIRLSVNAVYASVIILNAWPATD